MPVARHSVQGEISEKPPLQVLLPWRRVCEYKLVFEHALGLGSGAKVGLGSSGEAQQPQYGVRHPLENVHPQREDFRGDFVSLLLKREEGVGWHEHKRKRNVDR
jgi:hypothetical protein